VRWERIVPRPTDKSLFASFSSEKEESSFLPSTLSRTRQNPPTTPNQAADKKHFHQLSSIFREFRWRPRAAAVKCCGAVQAHRRGRHEPAPRPRTVRKFQCVLLTS
jgi:hypothetical protein